MRAEAVHNEERFELLSQVLCSLKRVMSAIERQEEINQLYYQKLCWWRVITLVVAKTVRPGDLTHPVIAELKTLALRSLSRSVSPCIRQYYELLLVNLLNIDDGTLLAEMLDLLHRESKVGILGPLILILGYWMTKTNSTELFKKLSIYIASHIAYVRGLAQYYCFQFYSINKDAVEPAERFFFDELSSYSVGNKDSRKLMKNIGKGVESFKYTADHLADIRVVMTANYEKVEQDAISTKVYDLLEQEGRQFLLELDMKKIPEPLRRAL
jgi:hypothetical protein